jgi:hypothetical protein
MAIPERALLDVEAFREIGVVGNVITISIERRLRVPSRVAWEELADIEHHVDWMADAVHIDFASDRHRGLGTSFTCLTRIGPIRTRDVMEIVSWIEGSSIGVRHTGIVTGDGEFALHPIDDSSCRVSWNEMLHLPLLLGVAVAEKFARPILCRIWRRNLARFERSTLRRLESNEP